MTRSAIEAAAPTEAKTPHQDVSALAIERATFDRLKAQGPGTLEELVGALADVVAGAKIPGGRGASADVRIPASAFRRCHDLVKRERLRPSQGESHITRVERVAGSTKRFFEAAGGEIDIERVALIAGDLMAKELTGQVMARKEAVE